MASVTGVVLPNNGDRIKTENYNDPINKILTQVNGNLDSSNIAAGSLPWSVMSTQTGVIPDAALVDTGGWRDLPTVPTVVSSAGQKEHVIRYSGVDHSGKIQAGTKLKIPRTGTTPTTSVAFVSGSSQYASRPTANVTGVTFTDDFTVEAWVYLDAYTTATETVISRMDAAGANGFTLEITPTGQLVLAGKNGGSGNVRQTYTYESIPLNKWTHIAATLDMSVYTTGSCPIYINGVSVPILLFQAGTNPTSLVNTGDLSLGRKGSGEYFNGKIANARVWSSVRTIAQVRDNMNQETPASTTGLVAHFKGNGSWNDSSSNANHLTVVSGAVNNFASHPFSAVEYAIATKVAYTGGNTDVTIFTGSGALPNETLGATAFSNGRSPYGFPAENNKWNIQVIALAGYQAANSGAMYLNHSITVPTGSWKLGYRIHVTQSLSGAGVSNATYTLDTTTAVTPSTKSKLTSFATLVNIVEYYPQLAAWDDIRLTSPTVYYMNTQALGSSFTTQGLRQGSPSVLYAECPYL